MNRKLQQQELQHVSGLLRDDRTLIQSRAMEVQQMEKEDDDNLLTLSQRWREEAGLAPHWPDSD